MTKQEIDDMMRPVLRNNKDNMNNYTKAVDYIEQYFKATEPIQKELPNVATALEAALAILKASEHYDGSNVQE